MRGLLGMVPDGIVAWCRTMLAIELAARSDRSTRKRAAAIRDAVVKKVSRSGADSDSETAALKRYFADFLPSRSSPFLAILWKSAARNHLNTPKELNWDASMLKMHLQRLHQVRSRRSGSALRRRPLSNHPRKFGWDSSSSYTPS